jgi:hypothetical protein
MKNNSYDMAFKLQGQATPKPNSLNAMIAKGLAYEVKPRKGSQFSNARIALEADIYEQYVAWPSSAVRQHKVYLEEEARLDALLKSAAGITCDCFPVSFIHRGLACSAESNNEIRHCLLLDKLDDDAGQSLLIRR